ncbi:LLM class flavin-dependent oxidoreductase [Skermania piniformis]|uniref:LLM class flavin-dependent oxidoreductase n=1 Tax=Skermania pinensis TaxID=39122 RepID=A0ABX8SC44_9ACTN|nr:LLM class flavin-dependent oxidoreductase [Skermania piniformis]QXQ15358.1 LLM class flavin-dependent oxidoreductase [Skermania piniformis]
MALATERVRLGTLVTSVPRRHVAKLAREVSALDRLSGGRVIFGAGYAAPTVLDGHCGAANP